MLSTEKLLDTIEIRTLGAGDLREFKELLKVFEEVFEMEDFLVPSDQHLAKVLSREDFIVQCVIFEGRVIAGLTAYVLHQYYSTRPLAYIYDLAVLSIYQRQGLGKVLIDAIVKISRERNYEEVFVQADTEDTHALEFYRGTRPTAEEDVRHFYYTL